MKYYDIGKVIASTYSTMNIRRMPRNYGYKLVIAGDKYEVRQHSLQPKQTTKLQ